jgi:putative SOS response-associated peptidase YedK
MCGRFTLRSNASRVAQEFSLADVPDLTPRYNVAPSQQVFILRLNDEHRRFLAPVHWGLVPAWADDIKVGYKMINARDDGVATKPSFRHAFKKRRCLIVADGFYEWKKLDGKTKQPYYIRLKDERPFAFAGLWERWSKADPPVESCTIVTTEPNQLMEELHDRMPVILPPGAYDAWLDPAIQEPERLQPLLCPFPAGEMVAYPVSTVVNNQ